MFKQIQKFKMKLVFGRKLKICQLRPHHGDANDCGHKDDGRVAGDERVIVLWLRLEERISMVVGRGEWSARGTWDGALLIPPQHLLFNSFTH